MRTSRSNRARRREALTGALFLLPSLIGVCLLLVFPMADTVRRSFLTVAGDWRGLGNFRILMDNASFRLAALNTVRFLVTAVPLLLILSLGAALMAKRAPAFLKSSLLVPLALPVASLALLWRALLDAHGLVNAGLTAMGMSAVPFMDSGASFWVLVLSYVWKNIGYDMVLLLSALMNVPGSLYEAAQIDGANRVKQFRYITLPHLYPALFVTAVLSVINAFKVFREAYLVAGNYPHEDMYLLQHLFNNWFLRLDIDKLCGAATLVALAMMALILLLQKVW
ncbi:MAG: sugar ABC transporter permease, partial [Clostridia bacterium]